MGENPEMEVTRKAISRGIGSQHHNCTQFGVWRMSLNTAVRVNGFKAVVGENAFTHESGIHVDGTPVVT